MLLADKALASFFIPDWIKAKIREATRFSFTPEVRGMIEDLVKNTDAIERAVEFCRLPAEVVWYEGAVLSLETASINLDGDTKTGVSGRLGLLCVDQQDTVRLFMFSGALDKIHGCCVFPLAFDIDFKRKTNTAVKLQDVLTRTPKVILEGWAKDIESYRALAVRTFISSTALLNTPHNVETTDHPTPKFVNRKRAAKGKLPILSFKTVTLRLTKTQRNKLTALGVAAGQMRQHLVRGHFKVRKTGIFWWAPFLRGDIALGRIKTDYQVKV